MEPSEVPEEQEAPGFEDDAPEARDDDELVDDDAAEGLSALRRLRDRVQLAAQELQTLRRENAALHKRISELETGVRPDAEASASLLFDDDRDALRRKVEGFIDAIDRFLEQDGQPT